MTITSAVPQDALATTARRVAQLAEREPRLTPRSAASLTTALAEGRLVVAHRDDEVIGFVLAERCGPVWEAASLYIVPEHRSAALFTALIAGCERVVDADWLVATFDERFASYLQRRRGYRRIGVWGAAWRSRGAFILARLSRERRRHVARHVSASRPIILLGTHA